MKRILKGVLAILLSLVMPLTVLGDSVPVAAHDGYMQKAM